MGRVEDDKDKIAHPSSDAVRRHLPPLLRVKARGVGVIKNSKKQYKQTNKTNNEQQN